MNTYIFLFGQSYNLSDRYIKVESDTHDEAVEIFQTVRNKIGHLTDSGERYTHCLLAGPETDLIIERFHLTEVPLETPLDWSDR